MEVFDVSQEGVGIKNTDIKRPRYCNIITKENIADLRLLCRKKDNNNSQSFSKSNKEITNSIYHFGEPELETSSE